MLGAIIGDIVGSRWEFNATNDYNFELFSDKNSFTDDTICTIAIADAILKGRDYGESLHDWCRRYMSPTGGFGGRFRKWVESDHPHPYNSFGNGSAMRVSPVGMYFRDEDEVLKQAELTAECTHNHPMGINGAKSVAWTIHHAIKSSDGLVPPKQLEKEILDITICATSDFGFASVSNLDDYKNRFDETCQGTIPPAMQIIYDSESFEDAIRRAVSLGADADTIGAIVGSIAEHLWGIPEWMKQKAMTYLPKEMQDVVKTFYKVCEEQEDYRPKDKQLKQTEVMMLWKLGYGHMGKFLNGENPAPSKEVKATKESWKNEPMPNEGVTDAGFEFRLTEADMAILRQGHIPDAQEDHWFMYCDDEYIRYYRSWTGMCAFEAHCTYSNGGYTIDRLKINRNLCEFGVNGDEPAKWLFLYLIKSEINGPALDAWEKYFDAWKKRVLRDMEMKDESEQKENKLYETISAANELEQSELSKIGYTREAYRTTPEKIDKLGETEIFVFGSNKAGHHHGGAARAAHKKFGAVWGEGDGLHGQSYAISTMEGIVEMAKNINRFIRFATEHKELRFLVTPIGCGIAGYNPLEVAPLFRKAISLPNIFLPKVFWEYFLLTEGHTHSQYQYTDEWDKWDKHKPNFW